jgi:hypothetical protein
MHKASLALVTGGLIVVAAACGSSSTGPKGPTASAMAQHFDSLYVVAQGHSWNGRAEMLTFLELAAAAGATPSQVSVTVGGTTQTWSALSLSAVDTNSSGQVRDSGVITVAYSDYATVMNGVIADYDTTIGGSKGYMLVVVGDSLAVNASSGTYSGSITSTGAACSSVSGLSNPNIAALRATYACTEIKTQSSMTATFPATTGLDASLQSVSFANIASNGVRLFQ